MTDVNGLVDTAKDLSQTSQTSPTADEPPQDDLFERVMQFESKHPRVAQFLSEVTEVLNLLGI